ncbi:MAG: diaminopimelate decarboxylase [Dehalococcoidia bacterium]|nr:diaminopimelate decarboxylase [Dehalococcoidia bacterium]
MQHVLSTIAGVSAAGLAGRFGTPSFIYDQALIEQRIAEVRCFETVRFAQKACSNIAILALMRRNGVVVDAVSAGEIYRALAAGYQGGGNEIVYTADVFDRDALALIAEHRIPVNVGSPEMITQLGEVCPGAQVTLRINPGFGHGHSKKTNTGGDLSKHGIWYTQIQNCIELGERAGVEIHGLHMHIGSGTDFEHLATVCDAMVKAAREMGPRLEVISAGGGLLVPYRDKQNRIDIAAYHALWARARRTIEDIIGHEIGLEVEPGRYLVAEAGSLITEIRAVKKQGSNTFYLTDAGFETLVRPSMYGSYHEISIVPRDGRELTEELDVIVGGPLCESGDVFTQEEGGVVVTRRLPAARVGDYLVLHDAGAYGAAMSSNYNTRRLAAEVLVHDGATELIRERQRFDQIIENERIPASLR